MDLRLEIAKALGKQDIGLEKNDILRSIEIPPDKKMGDFSFPCFRLAKSMRKNPKLIAEELSEKLESEYFEKIDNVGPYINFYVDYEKLAEYTLKEVFEKKESYIQSDYGAGKNIVLDYSSTNIAKPFHIGHIRSTVIGDALKRIYQALGFNTIAINYLGDYGTQFGILLAAYKKWGDDEEIEKDPIRELLKLYVSYNNLIEEDETAMEEARSWFRRLEDEDEEALRIWKWFKEISLKEFNRVYDMLDIEFDSYDGEYFHSKFVGQVVEKLEDLGLLHESEDAMIVDLEDEDMPPAIILKRDGSSTYITRDIATAIYRKKKYDFYKNIYVVATQQNLHFKQLKKVLAMMGYDWADDCVHVSFGMVSLKDGTMSTRKGQVVFLEDVLNQAVDKVKDIIEERNPDLENKEEAAKMIGIGAVKFQELFNTRIKDYVFDWDEMLNFEGETGPYVQYTHARANSVLEKADIDLVTDIDYGRFKSQEEKELIMLIYEIPEVIKSAGEKLEPSVITRHLTEIAKLYNKFYNSTRILDSETEDKKARLLLTYASKLSIKSLLGLLGIQAPNKM